MNGSDRGSADRGHRLEATAEPVSAKVVVSGGFGVGKTTFVASISEIEPLRTEEHMTAAAAVVDDASKVETKTTTTVAMDFGRISIDDSLRLYLFGTPGQGRFAFMWDRISAGALGAVVLLDTARFDDCYAAIDYFESKQLPFVIAVNEFPNAPSGTPAEIGCSPLARRRRARDGHRRPGPRVGQSGTTGTVRLHPDSEQGCDRLIQPSAA